MVTQEHKSRNAVDKQESDERFKGDKGTREEFQQVFHLNSSMVEEAGLIMPLPSP